jgi:hypothetical protein
MPTLNDHTNLLSWFKAELKEGGKLHRYLLPPWVMKAGIDVTDAVLVNGAQRPGGMADKVACILGSAEWLEKPWPQIESAELVGIRPEGEHAEFIAVYMTFYVRIKGKIKCSSNCARSEVEIDIKLRIPIRYQMESAMLAIPFRLKMFLWGFRGARGIAELDPDIVKYVMEAMGPFLLTIQNSADLLCAAQLDMPALQKRLQDEIDERARQPSLLDKNWA